MGAPPIPLPVMLRIYFMQQWFRLSDPAAEEFLMDMEPARRFAGVDLRRVPDETTIGNFGIACRSTTLRSSCLRSAQRI